MNKWRDVPGLVRLVELVQAHYRELGEVVPVPDDILIAGGLVFYSKFKPRTKYTMSVEEAADLAPLAIKDMDDTELFLKKLTSMDNPAFKAGLIRRLEVTKDNPPEGL